MLHHWHTKWHATYEHTSSVNREYTTVAFINNKLFILAAKMPWQKCSSHTICLIVEHLTWTESVGNKLSCEIPNTAIVRNALIRRKFENLNGYHQWFLVATRVNRIAKFCVLWDRPPFSSPTTNCNFFKIQVKHRGFHALPRPASDSDIVTCL